MYAKFFGDGQIFDSIYQPGSDAVRPSYAELNMILAELERPDRAPQMPLLGPSPAHPGVGAVSGIAWLVLTVLN